MLFSFRVCSKTTLTRFCPFLTTYLLVSTFSMPDISKRRQNVDNGHILTTYLPRLVNVVCERPLNSDVDHLLSMLPLFCPDKPQAYCFRKLKKCIEI